MNLNLFLLLFLVDISFYERVELLFDVFLGFLFLARSSSLDIARQRERKEEKNAFRLTFTGCLVVNSSSWLSRVFRTSHRAGLQWCKGLSEPLIINCHNCQTKLVHYQIDNQRRLYHTSTNCAQWIFCYSTRVCGAEQSLRQFNIFKLIEDAPLDIFPRFSDVSRSRAFLQM